MKKRLSKHIKCHWCKRQLDLAHKSSDGIITIECTDIHSQFIINANDRTIRAYRLYHDVGDDRYKIEGFRLDNGSLLYKKSGSLQYKHILTLPYLEPKLDENGVVQLDSVLSRFQKLMVFL